MWQTWETMALPQNLVECDSKQEVFMRRHCKWQLFPNQQIFPKQNTNFQSKYLDRYNTNETICFISHDYGVGALISGVNTVHEPKNDFFFYHLLDCLIQTPVSLPLVCFPKLIYYSTRLVRSLVKLMIQNSACRLKIGTQFSLYTFAKYLFLCCEIEIPSTSESFNLKTIILVI